MIKRMKSNFVYVLDSVLSCFIKNILKQEVSLKMISANSSKNVLHGSGLFLFTSQATEEFSFERHCS